MYFGWLTSKKKEKKKVIIYWADIYWAFCCVS